MTTTASSTAEWRPWNCSLGTLSHPFSLAYAHTLLFWLLSALAQPRFSLVSGQGLSGRQCGVMKKEPDTKSEEKGSNLGSTIELNNPRHGI